jgi:SAM-dependent methyltransferase
MSLIPRREDDAVARTRAAYDRIVAPFVAQNTGPPAAEVVAFLDRFVSMLPAGAAVLDLGCGPAHQTGWLRQRGLRVMAGDLSSGMLAAARRFTDAPLVQLDMRALPFAGGSYRAVWSIASLLHLPKTEVPGTLGEVRRVLAPGGVLALAVQEGEGEQWDGGYVDGVKRFFARYAADEMTALLAAAGFAVETNDRVTATGSATRSWLRFLARAGGESRTSSAIVVETRQRVRQQRGE